VAILVENGFEQVELIEPRKALDEAGARTQVVSPRRDRVRGWNFTNLVSSRKPDDIPAFSRKMIETFSRVRPHARR
jgi:protease I